MRFGTIALASVLALSSMAANAADKVTLQLKWVTQAQFAGYYVAADQGFYEDEGLEVEIKPGGPDIAPAQVLAGGGADVVLDWMPSALATREKGVPMVNIAHVDEQTRHPDRRLGKRRESAQARLQRRSNPTKASRLRLDDDL